MVGEVGRMAVRDYRKDNLRGVLIALVVFCHLLVETSSGPLTGVLYQVIYVFHMPAFVFVTGYFARWHPQKIARGLLPPYVEFQLLTIVWKNLITGRAWFAGLTLLEPVWTLWYLFACVLWCATVPLLARARDRHVRGIVIGAAFLVSVVVGFVPWIGSTLDLSRLIVLYPFFCTGYYAGKMRFSQRISQSGPLQLRRLRLAATVGVVALMTVHYAHGACPKELLYRDSPYGSMWDCAARVILHAAACAWIVWLLVMMPARPRPGLTSVGRNTLPIYLLHTWLIRVLRLVLPLPGNELAHVLMSAALAVAFCVLLGNDVVGTSFRRVFCAGWLDRRRR